jgi:hypothetical protein
MKRLLILLVLVALVPATVSADELWIKNEGGIEVTVNGDVDSIKYDGLYAYNPDNGKLAACDIKEGWIVITGDIEGYEVTLACDQQFEDVAPEVKQVFEYNGTRISFDPTTSTKEEQLAVLEQFGAPPPPPDWPVEEVKTPKAPITYKGDGSGGDAVAPTVECDWTGQDYWLYT